MKNEFDWARSFIMNFLALLLGVVFLYTGVGVWFFVGRHFGFAVTTGWLTAIVLFFLLVFAAKLAEEEQQKHLQRLHLRDTLAQRIEDQLQQDHETVQ